MHARGRLGLRACLRRRPSRVGCAQIDPDATGASVTAFLRDVVAYFRQLGVRVTGVMTDNGAGYRSRRFAEGCASLGLRHLYTRPYTPRTNGKAERFIQTALRESAYARAYRTSRQRAAHLTPWLHHPMERLRGQRRPAAAESALAGGRFGVP